MNSVQCSRWRFVAGVLALGLTGGLAAAEGLAPGELPGGSEPLRSLSKAVNIWRGSWHSQATRESLLEKYSFLEPAVEQLEAVVRNRGPEATLAAMQVPDALCLTFLEAALKQLYLIQQIVSKEGVERALYLPTLAVAELRGRHFGGYCEYLFRDTLTKLLRAVMEVKQESTFSGGVYQLLAQLMSALEHKLDENLYQEPDAEVSMDGILTDLGRWPVSPMNG
ncbi:hypothetical protein WJX75_005875 [Coccomyxa subellipsoidea]|uniref:Uncharacterized protein n=1 Tax=Coccomyxa subellipsoidea TaxID=248742 RepID=A0ABR2Z3X9_9CHLO